MEMTNREFSEKTLKDICENINEPEWATQRQASKYRMGKGRVWKKATEQKRSV